MAKYFIEDIKCGISAGGMSCGPVPVSVIAEAKFKEDNGNTFYLCLAEVDGIPNFFQTEKSTYDMQISEEMDDDDIDFLNDHYISVDGEYSHLYEMTEEDEELLPLLKYLTYIVRVDWEECERFQKETKGKYVDEFEIPKCDIEKEYLDEMEED